MSYKNSIFSKILFPAGRYPKKRLAQKLQDKTILITGASFGIGEALTRILAQETDCRLVLVARTQEKLEKLKVSLSKNRQSPICIYSCDLTDQVARTILISSLKADQIDIFVSNAGKSIRRSIFKSLDRFHDFERTMELNYFAPVELSLALIPQLLQQKGQIINISAVNVHFPAAAGWAAYQASKTAFDQWLSASEAELAPKGLACTSIYLPLVRTRMIAPTKVYEHWPAMQPKAVARLICKAMLGRRISYSPWWTNIAAFFSRLFAPLWRIITNRMIRN